MKIIYAVLIFVPAAIAARLLHASPLVIFSLSALAIIPLAGVLIALFTVEQLVNGIRNGFDHPEPPLEDSGDIPPADISIQNRVQP